MHWIYLLTMMPLAAVMASALGLCIGTRVEPRQVPLIFAMLVIPMKTHRDEIIGVLQLINRKRDAGTRLSSPEVVDREVLSYDEHAVELVSGERVTH